MTLLEALSADSRSSNADFQSWAGGIQSAFLAFGWTQSSDTGQTNFTTANLANQGIGAYAIFQMGDSLQSSAPLYVKYQPYSSNSAPIIKWTIGTATDGAGNITGTNKYSFTQICGQDGSYGATGYNCYFSGASNRFLMDLYDQSTFAFQSVFAIERTHDSSGNDTSDGFSFMWTNTNYNNGQGDFHGCFSAFVSGTSTQQPYQQPYLSVARPWFAGGGSSDPLTMLQGSNIGVATVIPFDPSPKNPMLSVLVAGRQDYSAYQTIVVPMYGTNHTYQIGTLSIHEYVPGSPNNNMAPTQGFSGPSNGTGDGCLLFRFE